MLIYSGLKLKIMGAMIIKVKDRVTSLVMSDSDVEATKGEPLVYYHTVLSQQVMSPTPPARVIVTVFYQPTLLHVRVLVTQLGARVPSALLSQSGQQNASVGNWHT